MCDLKPIKAVSQVPGLAYFVAQPAKPAPTASVPQAPAVAALDQMFGYFAA